MMRIKLFLLLLIFALVMVPAISGCQPTAEPEPEPEPDVDEDVVEEEPQSWTLQFATFWPAVDFQVDEGHKGWAKEISDRVAAETPHTINFEWHYAGALLAAPEIFSGVADGVADLGSTCPVYTAGVFPLSGAIELPGFNNDNALVASVTMHEAWRQSELLQNEYKDVKIMHFWATGPGDFMTNTRVEKMEDLAGLQLRAIGGSGDALTLLGGTPVAFAMGQSYENLETGVVDGLIAPTDTLKGFRLAEVTKYITKTPFIYNIVFMKVMNWDTWNSFPPSVQAIFDEVNEKYVIEYGKLRTDNTVAGQEFAVSEYGHEVIELDPAEYQRWLDVTAPVTQNWIDKVTGDGLPGEEIIELFRTLDAKYSAEHGSYGN
jgi:TRAP-type transport system periplasmic protein